MTTTTNSGSRSARGVLPLIESHSAAPNPENPSGHRTTEIELRPCPVANPPQYGIDHAESDFD
jgi:hypothetical protein